MFAGWVNLERAAILVGIIFTVATYFTNLYFQHKKFKLEEKRCNVRP